MAARRGCALVVALIVMAIAVSMLAFGAIYLLMGREPAVQARSTLVIRLQGDLGEEGPSDPISTLLPSSRQPSVEVLVQNLRKAKVDSRISAILFAPTGLQTAYWAKLQELRDAITDFRRSGKPAYAHLEFGGQSEYYLATACDRVFLVPSSSLDLTGLASYQLFLRGTFDLIGVYPDIVHVGAYKTAANQYTEKAMTPEHREMEESLTTDLYEQVIRAVADGRKKSVEEVRALMDQGPFLPEEARAAGLIDDVAYEDQVDEKLKATDRDRRRIDLDEYRRISPSSLGLNRGARFAVIYASGVIVSGGGGYDPLNGPAVGSDTLIDAIRKVRKDTRVKAVILRIDSPGGAAVASDVIWRELTLASADKPAKPLVASMSDLAASGGYYIAMAAPTIVAEPGTLTGSIGIFGGKFVTGGTYGKLGVTIESISRGRNAEMNSPVRPYSEAERAELEGQLKAFYTQFVEKVAKSRRLTPERVQEIAQGRVWTGRQAKEIGLVDELGGLERAVALAKQQAKIPADQEVELVAYPPRRTLYDVLASQLASSDRAMELRLLAWLVPAEGRLPGASVAPMALFRRGEPLALAPFVFVR